MTAVYKHVYFHVLDNIVDEYNTAYHRTIKMKPIDVKSDSFAKYNEESNEKNPKFISNLNSEEIIGSFYEKDLQKTNQK